MSELNEADIDWLYAEQTPFLRGVVSVYSAVQAFLVFVLFSLVLIV